MVPVAGSWVAPRFFEEHFVCAVDIAIQTRAAIERYGWTMWVQESKWANGEYPWLMYVRYVRFEKDHDGLLNITG